MHYTMSETPLTDALLTAVRARLDKEGQGAKVRLADHLGVTKQHLHSWLRDKDPRKPDCENGLKLKAWVEGMP